MKNIYITFHHPARGISFLKQILAAFYSGISNLNNNSLSASALSPSEISKAFDESDKGLLFDEIYYMTAPQSTYDKLSGDRLNYRYTILSDSKVISSKTGDIWNAVINEELDDLQKEIELVANRFPERIALFLDQLQRAIHQYAVRDQIYWFKNFCPLPDGLIDSLHITELNINDLREPEAVSNKLKPFIEEITAGSETFRSVINISAGGSEVQSVWSLMAQLNALPPETRLITTHDSGSGSMNKRFKEFDLREIFIKPQSGFSPPSRFFEESISVQKQTAELKARQFLKNGFSMLILGERGIGKSRLIEKSIEKSQKIFSVNCAEFSDKYDAARILFGTAESLKHGEKPQAGLLEQADGGILFLDDVHCMEKPIQAALLNVMDTRLPNTMHFRRIGSDTVINTEVRLVFTSSESMETLRQSLLPGFFDKITQAVIELPPLRQSPQEKETALESVWNSLGFSDSLPFADYPAKDSALLKWTEGLELFGNYRDVQKIAGSYKLFFDFGADAPKITKAKTAFEYTKIQFEKYCALKSKSPLDFIDLNDTPDNTIKHFKKQLAEELIRKHGSAQKVVDYFAKEGYGITDKTLYNWKNMK